MSVTLLPPPPILERPQAGLLLEHAPGDGLTAITAMDFITAWEAKAASAASDHPAAAADALADFVRACDHSPGRTSGNGTSALLFNVPLSVAVAIRAAQVCQGGSILRGVAYHSVPASGYTVTSLLVGTL